MRRESAFTRFTKDKFSGKSGKHFDALHDPNLDYDTERLEKAAGPLERSIGTVMREIVKKGKENPEWYERSVVHYEQCTTDPVLTLVYSGLDDPDTVDKSPTE
jgi:hypothetical protein